MPVKREKTDANFEPPKIPIAWLAVTFILPLMILIVPELLTKDDIPFMTKAVFALSFLVIFLFISCLMLFFEVYNTAFRIQVLELKLIDSKQMLEKIKAQQDEIRMLEKQLSEAHEIRDTH